MTEHDLGRRDVLRAGAGLAAATLVFGDWTPAQAAALPKRKLGRTGLNVTTITAGTVRCTDRRVIDHAIDRGINLIHTCPGYTGGRAMSVVGQVMRNKRSQVFLVLKAEPFNIDGYLRTLNTDHVDILIPEMQITDVAAKNTDRYRDGFAALKRAGKVRYSGFACHTGMTSVLPAAAAKGWWDVILLRYNAGCRSSLLSHVSSCVNAHHMGILAMKTTEGLNTGNATAFQAGLRSLLGNPGISSLTIGMAALQHVDSAVGAVTTRDASGDREFERSAGGLGDGCTFCGECAPACPQGIALDDYLRAWQYRRRGDGELAEELAGGIPRRHSLALCDGCGKCNDACRQQVDVAGRVRSLA
ncbi:MAG: aldo/keto reductase [Armatimonadetes bacterium]|nr:aldo/keto reductase [Armatimonadota bacterium]